MTSQSDLGELRERLVALRSEGDQTTRMLEAVSILQTALDGTGYRAVIVGGLAVEFWTGSHLTPDIDVLLPSDGPVRERLIGLGFERRGRTRYWEHEQAELLLEMPADVLSQGDEEIEVKLDSGRVVYLLTLESTAIRRLQEFVGTGHEDIARQTMELLANPDIDQARLERRARVTGHQHALEGFQKMMAEKRPLDSADLHRIAQDLTRHLDKPSR